MKSEDSVPIVGRVDTCVIKGAKGVGRRIPKADEARLLRAECALSQDIPFDVEALYRHAPKAGAIFPLYAFCGILGSIRMGKEALFDRILEDIRRYPSRNGHPLAEKAHDVMMATVRVRLRQRAPYPDWIVCMNYDGVPAQWYPYLSFLTCMILVERHAYEAALPVIGMAGAYNDTCVKCDFLGIWLRLLYSVSCRETDRFEMMEKCFVWAIERAVTQDSARMFVPAFYHFFIDEATVMDRLLSEHAPDLYKRVRRGTEGYYLSTIRFGNHLTGGHWSDRLTRREFFVARHLNDGNSYKEIAHMLGLSVGYVRNIVSAVYEKLGIGSKKELKGLVW